MAINHDMPLLSLIQAQDIFDAAVPAFKPCENVENMEHTQTTLKEVREQLQLNFIYWVEAESSAVSIPFQEGVKSGVASVTIRDSMDSC
ncbi:MAG: hypothetical protein ACP5EQ_07710 [Candidatus Cloacimonadia bacterium]